ncbi:hypothetical protein V8C37DRAFT_404140 [Trichoderma ceciliae]
MGAYLDEWFTACFGFQTVLFYLVDERRPVSGTFSSRTQPAAAAAPPARQGWLPYLYNYVWDGSDQHQPEPEPEPDWLTFSDMAAYLVVTEKALGNVKRSAPQWSRGCPGASLNVDYETVRFSEADKAMPFKKLMSDRPVDTGPKWAPVFGKYDFSGPWLGWGSDGRRGGCWP